MVLPDDVGLALHRSLDGDGIVKPFAMDVKGLHAGQKGKAGSHLRALMKEWMESETGMGASFDLQVRPTAKRQLLMRSAVLTQVGLPLFPPRLLPVASPSNRFKTLAKSFAQSCALTGGPALMRIATPNQSALLFK